MDIELIAMYNVCNDIHSRNHSRWTLLSCMVTTSHSASVIRLHFKWAHISFTTNAILEFRQTCNMNHELLDISVPLNVSPESLTRFLLLLLDFCPNDFFILVFDKIIILRFILARKNIANEWQCIFIFKFKTPPFNGGLIDFTFYPTQFVAQNFLH